MLTVTCRTPSIWKSTTELRNRSVDIAYRRLERHWTVLTSVYSLVLAPPFILTATYAPNGQDA
jgi:hypothetical protein